MSSTSAPESGVGASEHGSTSAGDKISLDDVIAKLRTAGNEDTRGEEILAAAITLRDSSGRDRQAALRKMANAWGVTVNEKVEGKYKPRPHSALEKDIQASVCKAASEWEPTAQPSQSSALEWEPRAQPSQSSDTRSSSRPDTDAVLKKAKTTDAAGHGAAVATHATGTVHQLSDTPDDVLPNTLSRLGPDMYQCTLRSGTITVPIMEAFCQLQIDLFSGISGN